VTCADKLALLRGIHVDDLGALLGGLGELIQKAGLASGMFIRKERYDGHDVLGDLNIAVLPAADRAAVDIEEVGEVLDAELGECAAELERLRAAKAKRSYVSCRLPFEALEIATVDEVAVLFDDILELGEIFSAEKRNAAPEGDAVEGD
jgi:hypothetical protein